MTQHLLDRPVWNALTTRQANFACGTARARRFAPYIGPFAGTFDDEPSSLAELVQLLPAEGPLLLVHAEPIALPAGALATVTEALQLVLHRLTGTAARAREHGIQPLGPEDFPAMLSLATLTRPGPFADRTPLLGEFWGVKQDGVLIAMAGERMKQDGFTEVSGVCTHPGARGRGLARMLSTLVTARILERGETPYLHAYATNAAALALYESLGFRVRARMHVASVTLKP